MEFTREGFESEALPSDSTCFLEAESGKLDIKRRECGILFLCLLFKIGDYDLFKW